MIGYPRVEHPVLLPLPSRPMAGHTGHIAIVTDSTASLPTALAQQWDVTVVQMQVILQGQADDEGRVPMPELLAALRANEPVATSPPDVGAFFWNYQDAAAAGASAIVSLHISGKQSETVQRAREAAAQVNVPVHVLDSQITGTGLGWMALTAARVAQAGATPEQVIAAASERAERRSTLFYVDTLEYLRRGGRVGAATAWLGTKLSIKPILTVTDGEVAPLDKARGKRRALSRLVELAVQRAGDTAVDLAVEHFAAAEDAEELLAACKESIPQIGETIFTETSTTVGVHVGPGALGLSLSRS